MLSDDTVTTSMNRVLAITAAQTTSTRAAMVTSHRARSDRRVGDGGVGIDGVVHVDHAGLQADTELVHHVVVLVDEVVTVHHVLPDLLAERAALVGGAELHDHPDLFGSADVD